MYMPAGTTFVYMTYGMYYLLNISSQEPGAAVLLRALEPLCGMETMGKFRGNKFRLFYRMLSCMDKLLLQISPTKRKYDKSVSNVNYF